MLSADEKKALLKLSRHTLQSLDRSDRETVLKEFNQQTKITEPLLELSPCFVTLVEKKDGRLRGCIGCLETFNSLYKNVFYFTQQAALHDPRFDAVKPDEVPALEIHIAVLSPTQPLPSLNEVEIGRHGLVVESNGRRGVLLASVAVEQRWSKEEFRDQTCLKAGLSAEGWERYEFSYFQEVSFGE